MKKIAVLVSGGGTNLQALIDYERSHADCPYNIDVVISSTKTAYSIERAKNAGIDCVIKSPFAVMGKENAPHDHKYDVVGSLCENCDKFAIDRMLPEIEKGDLLVIHDTGAHGFSMGYNYNGRLRSAEVLLKEDKTTQLIRRAETPRDYFATFDCFDILKDMKHPEDK